MNEMKLSECWEQIPIGKENAVKYEYLMRLWNRKERETRTILHELSRFDNGDNYVLIRSASSKGFYRTDDEETIKQYRQECFNKGRSTFAPLKKIDRILRSNKYQLSFVNNLRVARESRQLKQSEVCEIMKSKYHEYNFDKSMLSKMENSQCCPTPNQVEALAEIYGFVVDDLIETSLYNADILF